LYNIVVFQGPSGSGKTTLQQKLGVPRLITWTTRRPRKMEHNGFDYHFVTLEEFNKMENNGLFLEVTEYKSNYYGTSIDSVKNINQKCKSIVVDKYGAKKIKELVNDKCLHIGVYANREDCMSRLIERASQMDDITMRLRDYDSEVDALFECDIIINNSNKNWENSCKIIGGIKSLLNN